MPHARASGNGGGLSPNTEPPATVEEKRERYRLAEAMRAAAAFHVRTAVEVAAAPHVDKYPLVGELLYPGAWLLTGRPKVGKSWFLLQLALAVAEGEPFLGYTCRQSEVLCVFSEDDDTRVQDRLGGLGVARPPDALHIINRSELPGLARKFSEVMTFETWLQCWLQEHQSVRLVLIDTETTVRQLWRTESAGYGVTRITETDYKLVRDVDELSAAHKLATVLVNHIGKLRGFKWTDPHELINRAYTTVAGAAGSMVLADPPDANPMDPTQRTRVFAIRGRDLPRDITLAVHQEDITPHFQSDGPFYEVQQTQLQAQLMLALDELMPAIEEGKYVSASDLASASGTSRTTVHRAIMRMVAKGNTYWRNKRLMSKPGKGGGYRLE